MRVIASDVPDALIIDPKLFGDQRGFFLETYQSTRYAEHGISRPFVQDNLSRSAYGVLRGLHYQWPHPQGKLVGVLEGEVYDGRVEAMPERRFDAVAMRAVEKMDLAIPLALQRVKRYLVLLTTERSDLARGKRAALCGRSLPGSGDPDFGGRTAQRATECRVQPARLFGRRQREVEYIARHPGTGARLAFPSPAETG